MLKYRYTKNWFLVSEIKKELLKHLNPEDQHNVLEIGCYEGLSACFFSDVILNHPNSTLDCVDPYPTFNKKPCEDNQFVDAKTEENFRYNISISKNASKIQFHKISSDEFFKQHQITNQYDFIYVDGCHDPDYIQRDMENSFSVLKPGGILWMDDYGGGGGTCRIPMDIFLKKYDGQCKIIHKKYQLGILKINYV